MIDLEKYNLLLVNGSERRPVNMEDLYQHFKARFIEEIKAQSPELLNFADLIDVSV